MSCDLGRLRRDVAAYGIRDTGTHVPHVPLDTEAWAALLRASTYDRTTGHLARAVADGAFALTSSQAEQLSDAHERALGRDLLVERTLLRAVAILESAGVPFRVLKGAAVAHTVYADPGLRSFGDVDLLVPGSHFDDALAALGREQGRRRYPEPRPGFDARFGKGVCVELPDGHEIDVHRTFVAGPFGLRMDPDELFADACAFDLGGRTLPGLADHHRFLHACFHAALGGDAPRVVALRDVAQILLRSELDEHRVLACCARWRCGIVVDRAIDLAWSAFELGAEPAMVRTLRRSQPSRSELRALDAYRGPHRSYARQMVAGVRWVRGLRAKLAYVRALLLPDADYLSSSDGGRLRRAARAVRLVRSRPVQR